MGRRLAQRFVVRADGCWEWLGYVDGEGYGRAWDQDRQIPARAHRVLYREEVGPIPDGLELDHLCRNPSCVNPVHLEPVTHKENMLRGRGVGSENARKTHCKHGHPFDEENTIVRPNGHRGCRACMRAAQARYRQRLVSEAA